MHVLVTSKFDEDPIKNEHASLETAFSNYKSMGIFLVTQRTPNSVGSGLIWLKFVSSEILCLSSLTESLKKI